MSYSQMVHMLREANKEKIVFVNAGIFYIAVEEDAVLLNNKLKLKCTCFQKNTCCKVGFPIKSLNKNLEKIEKLGYGYIVYNFDKVKRELIIVKEFNGKKNKTERKNINCLLCRGLSVYPDDVYLQAVDKLYTKQLHENK